VAIVEPDILGPRDGSVMIDLVEPGYEPKASGFRRALFLRDNRPSVVITIVEGNDAATPFLLWPGDFVKV